MAHTFVTKFLFLISFFALSFFVGESVLAQTYINCNDCAQKIETDCRLNRNPQDVPACIKNAQQEKCPLCSAGGILGYCWCQKASLECENHGKPAINSETDCQNYCKTLGYTATNWDTTRYIERRGKSTTAGQCPEAVKGGAMQAPTTGGTPGSSPKLYNPLGENVTLFTLVGRLVKAILGIVGAIALLMFIYGGVLWIISGGSETRVKTAKNVIIHSTIGLIIIFFSYTLVSLFLGAFNPGS